jgi:hypothetical protein
MTTQFQLNILLLLLLLYDMDKKDRISGVRYKQDMFKSTLIEGEIWYEVT